MEQDRASGGGVAEGGPRQKASDGRLRQLDSIRGIAALFVLFNHYVQVVPERLRPPASLDQILTVATWTSAVTWLRFTPLRLLVDGEAAVDLFFVLSGFVLALPMTQRSQPALWAFLAKRFCRVYLPFAGVILIVAAAYQLIPTAPSGAVSHWLNGLLVRRGGYSLTAHLLMRGRQTDMRLDPVMWSLVHELRVSIVLPAIFLAIRWIGAAETVAASVLISLTASVGMADSVSGDWQATAHFLWMFAAGSALSYHREDVMRLLRRCTRRTTLSLWALTLMLLIVPFDRVWADFLIGSGAALLICLCLNRGWTTEALSVPALLWLGRVSYSLYLVHLPLLIFAATCGLTAWGLAPIFVLTLVLAELTYRSLEQPSHRIGVRIARSIGPAPQPAG